MIDYVMGGEPVHTTQRNFKQRQMGRYQMGRRKEGARRWREEKKSKKEKSGDKITPFEESIWAGGKRPSWRVYRIEDPKESDTII
jgi:hypothetical protein